MSTKIIKSEIIKEKKEFEIDIFDKNNKVVGSIELNKLIWGIKVNPELISFVVIAEQAAKRQGTKKVKERGEVSGGGKKPWKQKGTGRARAGSIRSPIWRGGGVTFGPTGKENYVKKVNKKVNKKALLGCLNQILVNEKIIILKEFEMKKPSTFKINEISKNLKILGKKILFIVDLENKNLILSLRNIKNYKFVSYENITIYDLLNSNKVIFFEKTINDLEKRLVTK